MVPGLPRGVPRSAILVGAGTGVPEHNPFGTLLWERDCRTSGGIGDGHKALESLPVIGIFRHAWSAGD